MTLAWFARALIVCLAAVAPGPTAAFETRGTTALVVDHATGATLYAKNADRPMPPASMSKLMTLYMLFEAIRDGRVTHDTEFFVSERAQAMGGSRMFVEAGKRVPVRDLILGIVVQSGNDACVVVAENLMGSEEAFAAAMTERARELGMNETVLKNSSGWSEPGHVMSAEDLVTLSRRIIDEFPEEYAHFAETEYTWNGITQQNRNPLLESGLGVDGLKTGHTAEAGYGLAGSAVKDGQRIVFVVSGLEGVAERAAESAAIVNWAFGAFETLRFFDAGDTVAEAEVWLGAAPTVPLVAPGPLQMLAPRGSAADVAARAVYDGPVAAPVAAGQPLGRLVIEGPGIEPASFALVAGADVPEGGIGVRIGAAGRFALDRALGLIPGRD
jgi:D-alanyl-D-alanine carboxypeptidase (penicillin-binding protein 5/6)